MNNLLGRVRSAFEVATETYSKGLELIMMNRKIVTEELVIVNREGEPRAVLRAEEGGAALRLLSDQEDRGAVLEVGRHQGRDQVALSLYGEGSSAATIDVDENGTPSIYLSDPTGRRRVQAGVTKFGEIRIDLIDMDHGNLTLRVSDDGTEIDLSRHSGSGVMVTAENEHASVHVAHKLGNFDAGIGADTDGGWVNIYAEDHKVVSSL